MLTLPASLGTAHNSAFPEVTPPSPVFSPGSSSCSWEGTRVQGDKTTSERELRQRPPREGARDGNTAGTAEPVHGHQTWVRGEANTQQF